MSTIAIPAHFDGKHIVLDEPVDLPPNANLLVTVLPSNSDIVVEDAWLKAAGSSEAFG